MKMKAPGIRGLRQVLAAVMTAAVATTFARDNSKTIVCYGDSLTAGQASVVTQPTLDNYQNGYLNGKSVLAGYPYFLAKSLKDDGFSVVNISRGGMKTANILAMQGTKTFKTVKAFTLPADTSLVDFNNGMTDKYGPSQSNMAVDNAVATPPQLSPDEVLTTDENGTCGSMCGVLKTSAGDIRVRWRVDRDNGNYLNIRRMTAGSASVTVPAGTVFVPDCAGNYRDAIQVIFAGQNDGAAGSASSIVPQIQSAVNNIDGGKRYVVVSYHTATDANCDAMKNTFDDAFGNHHLYLYGELKNRGLKLAEQLGETATASTWNTKTTGLLANDGLHFNRAGYHVLAHLVEEKLQALGYLDGTSGEDDPTPTVIEGRTISNASLSGTAVTFDLGAAANDVSLWVAGGASDLGDSFDDWAAAGGAKFVKIVAKGSAAFGESVDLAAYGLADANVVRLFTRPAYDATLTGLVGNRGAVSVGPYLDTRDTPNLADRLVAEVTTASNTGAGDYEAIFSARATNAQGDRSMTAFICHTTQDAFKNRMRIDYGTYAPGVTSKTSGFWSGKTRYAVALNANLASVLPDLLAETPVKAAEAVNAGGSLLLFATRADSSGTIVTNHVGKFTLHAFHWYDSKGALKHDYVPVTSAAGENTVYDTVEGKLLAVSKAGTGAGDFGAGEVVTSVTGSLTFSAAIVRTGPVEPAVNSWTIEPSVSPASWTEGEAAGTLSLGAAEYGEVTCDHTQEQLNALTKGTYTVKFTVAATDARTGLAKSVTVTVAEKQASLSAAEWTAYMQGVDTAEKLAAVKARVAGKKTVKIAFANSATSIPSGGTPHDTFEQNEMLKQAAYFGLNLEIVRVQPVDLASGRTLGVVYQEAVDKADIVCDFSSYWDDSRNLAAKVIADNPDKLFVLPYGEIGSCPPTGTSLQGMAQHRDGTGYQNMILTSPIGPTTGGALTYVSRRTADDTETITFVIPSGWAGSTGDTCRSASMAGVLAAWIWAVHGDSPTAAEIVKLLADASALPTVSETAGFTSEHLETLKANLAAYAATDDLGRSKLIYDKPVNMYNLLSLLPEPEEPVTSGGAWYRLTVDAVRSGNDIQFSEFYLYDAQGNRLNLNLTVASVTDASQLNEGECFQTGMNLWSDGGLGRLFDDSTVTKLGGSVADWNNARVIIRLRDGATVAAYNFATGGDDATWGKNRQLTAWTLEASEDGKSWTEINKVTSFNPPAENKVKYSPANFTVGGNPEPPPEDPSEPEGPISFSGIFQDHMVLQRDQPPVVWGKGPTGATVTVAFGGKSATSDKIGDDGIWTVVFATSFAANCEGRSLTATCSNGETAEISDVVVGDVWIAAGQSNMAMALKGSAYGDTYGCDEAVAEMKNYPQVRMRSMDAVKLDHPSAYDVYGGPWKAADSGFSAVAFHFALGCVRANPSVPVGILQAALNAQPLTNWRPGGDAILWNSQLAPIVRFRLRGAIWYQGENEDAHNQGLVYKDFISSLVGEWRAKFGYADADFPFYAVSLAGWGDVEGAADDPSGDIHPNHRQIREGLMRARRSIVNFNLAQIWDCGRHFDIADHGACIHPRCKNVVGERLALLARKDVYREDVVADSPCWTGVERLGDGKIRVTFDMGGSKGLATGHKLAANALFPTNTPNAAVKGFAVAGADKVWHWADATIDPSGNAVTLTSATCLNPIFVRYAYRCNPIDGEANLYNAEMLPVAPFATDYDIYPVPPRPGYDPDAPVETNVVWQTGPNPVAFEPAAKNLLKGIANPILTDGRLVDTVTVWSDNAMTWTLSDPADLRELGIYSKWSDAGRDGFGIASVAVRYDGESAFETLVGSELKYFDLNDKGQYAILAAKDGEAFARDVAAVRVTFGTCDHTWIGIAEVELVPVGGDEPEPSVHKHQMGAWTTNVVPTCQQQGVETRICVAEGCSEPPYAETNTLAKVDHVYVDGKCTWCGADEPQKLVWTCFGLAAQDFEPMPADENAALGCTATSAGMTDGTLNGKSSYQSNWVNGPAPVVTFGEPTDISEVRFYSSWDAGRDGFGIKQVNVRYDGETKFTRVESIPEFSYTDANKGNMCAAICAPEGQTLAKNVIAVQIILGSCDNNWIGIGEIEVRKFMGSTPSAPTLSPSKGTLEVVVKAKDADEAKGQVVITPPEGVEVSTADYAKCFALKAIDAGDGNWTVSAALDAEIVRPTLASGADGSQPFELGAEDATIRVGNVRPGLYYGYVMAEKLADLAAATPVMQSEPAANSDPLTLTVPQSGKPEAFYRIIVQEHP